MGQPIGVVLADCPRSDVLSGLTTCVVNSYKDTTLTTRRQCRIMNSRKQTARRNLLVTRLSELGFTQESFANQVGVTLRTVQRWVAGTQVPSLSPFKTRLICETLNWSLDDLVAAFPESEDDQNKNA